MQSNETIKKKLANNTLWNGIERFSTLGIQLLCTFILARFLTPQDFGIVGMIVVFTAIGNTIIDSGFSQALIREKEVTDLQYSSVFYFNIALSIVIYIVLFLCSGWIADFYKLPILRKVCIVTFLVIPVHSLSLIQYTYFVRNLEFKKLCIISSSAALLSSIVAVIVASYLRNVWALVIQNLLMYVFRSLFLWIVTPWHPKRSFSYSVIRKFFKFSKNLLLSGLIGTVFNNIHSIIIGRVYSATDLGFFSQADRIKNVASMNITQVIQSVTYPVLAQVNGENKNLKDLYKKIILVTMIFVGLIMSIIMGISRDLFELLMGDEVWRIAGVYLFILSINGILYPLHAVNQNILLVKGKSSTILKLEITRRCLMILILYVSLHFDILYFVCGNALYSILLLFLNLRVCGAPINYSLYEQLKDITPILLRFSIIVSISLLSNYLLRNVDIHIRFSVTLILSILVSIGLFYKNYYCKQVFNLILAKIKK